MDPTGAALAAMSSAASLSAAAAAAMLAENGICSVCGDKSAGRHYGVMACYGCKGFFRRTIRSKQTYNCRFQKRCSIDKDQRNACRFCRFQRCLQVGMEVTAIRPDRDVIGKQKNPRKKKLLLLQNCKQEEEFGSPTTTIATMATPNSSRSSTNNGFGVGNGGRGGGGEQFCGRIGTGGENCSLSSPGTESNGSQQEEFLLGFLMDIHSKAGSGSLFSEDNTNTNNNNNNSNNNNNNFPQHQQRYKTSTNSSTPPTSTIINSHSFFCESSSAGGDCPHHHSHQQQQQQSAPSSSSTSSTSSSSPPREPLMELAIGIAMSSSTGPRRGATLVKPDPEVSLFTLLHDPYALAKHQFEPISPVEPGRIADTQQFSAAMRKYVLMCVDWVNALFVMACLENTEEKFALLRNCFAAFCIFEQAASTANLSPHLLFSSSSSSPPLFHQQQQESIYLCNGAILTRELTGAQQQWHLLSNNLVARMLDELVLPLRRLRLSAQERVALTALILLDGDRRSSMGEPENGGGETCGLYLIKDQLQNALFQHVRERCEQSLNRASSRFANILLLLPAVAKVSSLFAENGQMTRVFGRQSRQYLDPLLAEVLGVGWPANIFSANAADGNFGNCSAVFSSSSSSSASSSSSSAAAFQPDLALQQQQNNNNLMECTLGELGSPQLPGPPISSGSCNSNSTSGCSSISNSGTALENAIVGCSSLPSNVDSSLHQLHAVPGSIYQQQQQLHSISSSSSSQFMPSTGVGGQQLAYGMEQLLLAPMFPMQTTGPLHLQQQQQQQVSELSSPEASDHQNSLLHQQQRQNLFLSMPESVLPAMEVENGVVMAGEKSDEVLMSAAATTSSAYYGGMYAGGVLVDVDSNVSAKPAATISKTLEDNNSQDVSVVAMTAGGIDRASVWRQQRQHRSLQAENVAASAAVVRHGPRHMSACSPPLSAHSVGIPPFYQVQQQQHQQQQQYFFVSTPPPNSSGPPNQQQQAVSCSAGPYVPAFKY